MNINFELYRIFYVVATVGNITKASQELNISQPAVTKQIKSLEAQLGGDLFIRTKRGVILTENGRAIYNYIKPTGEPGIFLAYYLVKNKYFYPLYAELKIEKNNVIHPGVMLKGDIALYPSEDILNSKTKLIKYCDSYYNDFIEKGNEVKCKTLVQ